MSPAVWDAMMALRGYLFENVYLSQRAKAEEPRAARVVQMLFGHFLDNTDELPAEHVPANDAERVQRVVDYVAGMTDRFALRAYRQIFMPREGPL